MVIVNTTPEGNLRSGARRIRLMVLLTLMIPACFGGLKAQGLPDTSERPGSSLFGIQSTKSALDIGGSGLGPGPLFPCRAQAAERVGLAPAIGDPNFKLKPQPAKRTAFLVGLYVAQVALQSLDARTTVLAVREGKGREGNPILNPFASSPPLFVGFKIGATVGVIGTFDRLHKTRPRAATITMLAADLCYAFVVEHNLSVLNAGHSGR